jgi:hypothetical protein
MNPSEPGRTLAAERYERVDEHRDDAHDHEHEQRCHQAGPRRPGGKRQPGQPEGSKAGSENRIVVGETTLDLGEHALLVHRKRHGATSA